MNKERVHNTTHMHLHPHRPTSKNALKVGGSPLVHALQAASQSFLCADVARASASRSAVASSTSFSLLSYLNRQARYQDKDRQHYTKQKEKNNKHTSVHTKTWHEFWRAVHIPFLATQLQQTQPTYMAARSASSSSAASVCTAAKSFKAAGAPQPPNSSDGS